MITIYKYPFPTCNPNSIASVQLPKDAQVIRLDSENGYAYLWAIVNTEAPVVTRRFALHKTGSNMDNTAAELDVIGEDPELWIRSQYVGRFGIWAEMELMMYVFDLGEMDEGSEQN